MSGTKATRSSKLKLNLDFRTATTRNKSLRAYAAEIKAGMTRSGMTQRELADEAGVNNLTVWMHANMNVKNPQVRTMFNILFALGWEEITITQEKAKTKLAKAA